MHKGSEAKMSASDQSSLRRGLPKFLILTIISTGEVYAQDILNRLEDSGFSTQEGTLYPLLSRMAREGLLNHQWQESQSGPPRKYYTLTEAGRSVLSDFRQYWKDTTQVIDDLGKET